MAKSVKTLGLFKGITKFDEGIGARLPQAYRKFYKEWQETQPAAVHYVERQGKWERDEVTGEMSPIQNVPILPKFPKEHNYQLWGGEGIIQGYEKRGKKQRRVPHFWFPNLKRSVVYSEILNKYISVIMTDRAIDLINSNYGFDHYLLKTPACDLRGILALRLKRLILEEITQGCPTYKDNPKKQQDVYDEYKEYLSGFTTEEIEWYGYTFDEACKKMEGIIEAQEKPFPLKHIYRAQLIEKLKAAENEALEKKELVSETGSWIHKINPFAKKHET